MIVKCGCESVKQYVGERGNRNEALFPKHSFPGPADGNLPMSAPTLPVCEFRSSLRSLSFIGYLLMSFLTAVNDNMYRWLKKRSFILGGRQLRRQPGPGKSPVVLYCRFRHFEHLCCFFDIQPAKVSQLKHPGMPWIQD